MKNNYSKGVKLAAFAALVLFTYFIVSLVETSAYFSGYRLSFTRTQGLLLFVTVFVVVLAAHSFLIRSKWLNPLQKLYTKKPEIKLMVIAFSAYLSASGMVYFIDPDTPVTDFLYVRSLAYGVLAGCIVLTISRFVIENWFPFMDRYLESDKQMQQHFDTLTPYQRIMVVLLTLFAIAFVLVMTTRVF